MTLKVKPSRLATEAEKNALAKKIKSRTEAFCKKVMKK